MTRTTPLGTLYCPFSMTLHRGAYAAVSEPPVTVANAVLLQPPKLVFRALRL